VVVSFRSSSERKLAPSNAGSGAARVAWHDVECGSYGADLALWHELAEDADPGRDSDAILEVGSGTGRVALDLLRAGHRVTALDIDDQLLRALRERAAGSPLETVCADARTFELGRRDFALCLVPMQTVQLLGGSGERIAFLRQAHAHLRPGGLLACAIVTELAPFDCATGDIGPSADVGRSDGERYVSRAVRVSVRMRSILIEREREILTARRAVRARERDVIELARVTAAQLEREGAKAGFTPARSRSIAATEEHVGSAVVMLRA
jgi:SAM-dependent methyltransferase